MPLNEAKRKANNKYIKENMTVLGCKVKKTDAERYREIAKQRSTTINAVLKQALENMANNKEDNTIE